MEPVEIPRRDAQETAARYAPIRQEIHLFERDPSSGTPGLSLSHWVDWEIWQRVKNYFIEVEEGDWVCRTENAAAVEEALQVLPENRWERVRARKAAQKTPEEHLVTGEKI